MTAHLTDAQLAEIEARLYRGKSSEFYTPGPPPYTYGDFITQLSEHGAEKISEGNIELIEHAPADIATLLQALRAERAEVARLRGVAEDMLYRLSKYDDPAIDLWRENIAGKVQP